MRHMPRQYSKAEGHSRSAALLLALQPDMHTQGAVSKGRLSTAAAAGCRVLTLRGVAALGGAGAVEIAGGCAAIVAVLHWLRGCMAHVLLLQHGV